MCCAFFYFDNNLKTVDIYLVCSLGRSFKLWFVLNIRFNRFNKHAKQQLTNMEIEMEQIEHQARISECTVNALEAAKSDMMEKLTLMEMDTEILQEREIIEIDDLRSQLRDSQIEVEDLREKNSVFTRPPVANVGGTNAGGAFSKKKDGMSACSLDFSVTSANKENLMGV